MSFLLKNLVNSLPAEPYLLVLNRKQLKEYRTSPCAHALLQTHLIGKKGGGAPSMAQGSF